MSDDRAYLLSFGHGKVEYPDVKAFLNKQRDVVNWFYFLPNTFLLVLRETGTRPFARRFGKAFPGLHFMVSAVPPERDGRLSALAWELMTNPRESRPEDVNM